MSQQPPSDNTPRGRPSSSGSSPRPPGAQPPGAQRRGSYDASPYDHELSTDPGRPHAYESLYRGSQDRGRPTPRHWEPNLKPPEAPTGDDTYGWLYRPEPSEPTSRPSPAVPPVIPVAPAASRPVDRRLTTAAPVLAPEPALAAPRRTGRTVLIVLLVVLVLGAAAAAGMIWQS